MNKKIILISIDKWCLKYLNDSFTDNLLAKTTLITNKISSELKSFAKKKKVKIIKTSKIMKKDIQNLDIKGSIVLSAGSPWIFEKKTIKKLGKNFYNVHQSPLPSMRGSVATYIIMYDIKAFQTCIHRVTAGIDTGNIVYKKNLIIPSTLRVPFDVNEYLQLKNREMVKEFLKNFNEKKLKDEKQNNFFSSYNKRCSAKINGWIDWSMNVDDLDRFIRAYGHPYGGARTFISNSKVHIEDIEKSKNEPARHPEEIGKVLRRYEGYIVVSVNGGSLFIKKVYKNKKNISNLVKPGDKFYTKINYLDYKNHRAIFINQSKIYNNKVKIKKL